jgi:hypothetical protein
VAKARSLVGLDVHAAKIVAAVLDDVTRDEIRAPSVILQQLDRLGARFQGPDESRLLRFALTDSFNAGARAAATAAGATVTTVLSRSPKSAQRRNRAPRRR